MTIGFVFMIFALVSFLLGAVGVQSRVSWVCLGLALWVLAILIGGISLAPVR